MLKNIHVHLKKRIFTKNLVHIHMENTDSGKPVQFQNRLVSLRSLEKWSRVWQFSNHLSLRQNTQFWKAGVPFSPQTHWLPPSSSLPYHLCYFKHNSLSSPTKGQSAKYEAQSLRFHGGLQFSSAFQAEEQEWLEGWLTLP